MRDADDGGSVPDRRALLLWIGLALCVGCGDPNPAEPAHVVAPISGATLDAVQANLRVILDRDFAGARAEHVRVERSDEGRRAVVHASLANRLEEAGYERLCSALREAASPLLGEGQRIELYLLVGEAVVHSCGL